MEVVGDANPPVDTLLATEEGLLELIVADSPVLCLGLALVLEADEVYSMDGNDVGGRLAICALRVCAGDGASSGDGLLFASMSPSGCRSSFGIDTSAHAWQPDGVCLSPTPVAGNGGL